MLRGEIDKVAMSYPQYSEFEFYTKTYALLTFLSNSSSLLTHLSKTKYPSKIERQLQNNAHRKKRQKKPRGFLGKSVNQKMI